MKRAFRLFILLIMMFFSPMLLMAQENGHKEIKANSAAYTGDFFITFLDGNSKYIVTKLRIAEGSYNEWHIHPEAAQTMFVIEGEGYYQEEGKDMILLRPGEMVTTPANVKHWNGSTPDSHVTVITITEVNDQPHVEWLGKISSGMYERKNPTKDNEIK